MGDKLSNVGEKIKERVGRFESDTLGDNPYNMEADTNFNIEEYEAGVIQVTANDDERPKPELMESLIKTALTADSSVCTEVARIISTRLHIDVVRIKIKSLDLIMQILTSKHRSEKSKFRLCIQRATQELITELQDYECDPDPTFGDKPCKLVQSHAKRLTQLLADNLGRVAPKGEIKIGARKKHESKLEINPGAKIGWEFKLESKDIGFSVNFVVERDTGETETVAVVEYTKLYAEREFLITIRHHYQSTSNC